MTTRNSVNGKEKPSPPLPTRKWIVFVVFAFALGGSLLSPQTRRSSVQGTPQTSALPEPDNIKRYISLTLLGRFPHSEHQIHAFDNGIFETFQNLTCNLFRITSVSTIRLLYKCDHPVGETTEQESATSGNVSSGPDAPQSLSLLLEIQGFCKRCLSAHGLFDDSTRRQRLLVDQHDPRDMP